MNFSGDALGLGVSTSAATARQKGTKETGSFDMYLSGSARNAGSVWLELGTRENLSAADSDSPNYDPAADRKIFRYEVKVEAGENCDQVAEKLAKKINESPPISYEDGGKGIKLDDVASARGTVMMITVKKKE
jgi:hypothetical protein